MKKCTQCLADKEFFEFSLVKNTDRYRNRCKPCRALNAREKRKDPKQKKKNKEYKKRTYSKRKVKHLALKQRYNISIEDFDKILERQNGVCAICFQEEGFKNRSLAVDHCHTTGKIRGLLCGNCNQGIGNLRDSVNYLQNAIKYLKG